ncbi:MAG: hypothetical protein JWP04_3558 [Belnapia sp.]|nr:hypothetical protein [Belnapia sp.]
MAILVSGAAGFVGLNVVAALRAAGEAVVAFDALSAPARAPDGATWVQGDIRSAADWDRAFRASPVTALLHAAVVTAGPARERADPEPIVAVNIGGAVAAVRAAARHGVGRLFYLSSGSVYGHPPAGGGPYDEATSWPRPLALYGITKLAAEQTVLRLAEVAGIAAAAARLGSVYGPWEWATGVRDTLSPAMQALDAFDRDGEAVLGPVTPGDQIYSRDVAAGLVALLRAPAAVGVFNLGTGRVSDVADFCRAVARVKPGFRWRMAGPGEVPNAVTHMPPRVAMAVARIRAATGWVAGFDTDRAAADLLAWRAG